MVKSVIVALLLITVIFGSVFGYAYWRNYQAFTVASKFKPPPTSVSTFTAEPQNWNVVIKSVGSLVAVNSVNITTDIEGKVTEILFKSGQIVEKGDLIIQLDDELLQQNLKDRSAQLILNQDNFNRLKKLYAKSAVARNELDLSESLLIRSRAQVQADKIKIRHKKVQSPFAGKLGIRIVNLGDYIKPGDPIVNVESMDPLYVDFTIPERFISQLKVGQTFIVTVDAYADKQFNGKLTALNSVVDINTRNMTVRGEMNNPQHKLYPGMFANVTLHTGVSRKSIVVPRTAISYSTFGDTIYVVNKDKKTNTLTAIPRNVKLGKQRGSWVEVLSGIEKSDQVIVSGQLKLRPNSPIVINNSNPMKYEKLNHDE